MTGVTVDNCETLFVRQVDAHSFAESTSDVSERQWLWSHASVLVGHYILVSGGYNSSAKARSDFFKLNTNTWEWSRSEDASLAVAEHLAFLVGDEVVLTSGTSPLFRDVGLVTWRFDLVTEQVESSECRTGRLVPQNKCAGEYLEKLGLIILFGGTVGMDLTNRVVGYDVQVDTWQEIKPKGRLPVPRYGHSSCLHGSFDIFFYGGTDTRRNDRFPGITHLRYVHQQFVWMATEWTPKPAAYARSSITCTGHRIYILGGSYRQTPVEYMYVYDMRKRVGTQLLGKKLEQNSRPGIVTVDGTLNSLVYHSAVLVRGRVVVTGGLSKDPNQVYLLSASEVGYKPDS